jgi:hypothetical protein
MIRCQQPQYDKTKNDRMSLTGVCGRTYYWRRRVVGKRGVRVEGRDLPHLDGQSGGGGELGTVML